VTCPPRETRPSAHPFLTPAHALRTASALKGLQDLREAQAPRDHAEREEIAVLLVEQAPAVIQDFQEPWDHQVHKALTDFLCLESLVAKDPRERTETQVCPVVKVLLGLPAL